MNLQRTARLIVILYGKIFIFLWPPSTLFCQQVIYPEAASFRGRFTNYVPNNPTADMSTTCQYFDHDGYMWMGTFYELYRFDGTEYRVYYANRTDSTGLAGNYVTEIFEDPSGTLWVCTLGALNRFDRKTGTFVHYSPDTTDYTDPCNMIHFALGDSRGKIWLVTETDIYAFDSRSETFRRFPIDTLSYLYERIPLQKPGRILEDERGMVWITTPCGLYRYDPRSDSLEAFLDLGESRSSSPAPYVTNIRQDPAGTVWFSTLDGLYMVDDPLHGIFKRIDLQVKEPYKSKFDSIFVVLPDKNGNIWVFGNFSVSRHRPATGFTDNYLITPPAYFTGGGKDIYENSFQYAFQDSWGAIWFLYSITGLMYRMDPENLETLLFQVPNWAVFNCTMDREETFWFGCVSTNSWRLVHRDLSYTEINLEENVGSIVSEKVEIIVETGEQTFLSLSSGVYTTENLSMKKEFVLKPFEFPDGRKPAHGIYMDRSGKIWFGRENGKIISYSRSGSEFHTYTLPFDHTGAVTRFHEDQAGNLWMKTLFGIYRMKLPEGEVACFVSGVQELDNTFSKSIQDVCFDHSDRMWIAPYYGKGIYRYDILEERMRFYGPHTGLDITFSDYGAKIAEDWEGNIWVLFGSSGLFRYLPEEDRFVRFNLKEAPGERFSFMDFCVNSNGLIAVSHTAGMLFYDMITDTRIDMPFTQLILFTHLYQARSGDLFYLVGNKLYCFPSDIPVNRSVPPVYLTSIKVNNVNYYLNHPEDPDINDLQKISLKHNQNSILIAFTALHFNETGLSKYRYILEGFDRDTVAVNSDTRFAEYKRIPAGNYHFWVTGSNESGIWNPDGKSLDIKIFRPWYGSIFACCLYVILMVSSILLILRQRMRDLTNKQRHLEELVSLRTAELKEKSNQIEEMDRVKTKFFTEISHEIRTPLSLIAGPVENLISENDGKLDDRSYRWLEVIRRNGERLTKLVNQLLDISRLDAGSMKLTLSESDVIKCIRVIAYGFLSMAETRKIHYLVRIPDKPQTAYFDRDKIEKILSNLLSNAFKFTPQGGTITCTAEIQTRPDGPETKLLELSVRDTGTGIARENLDKIFDRFYRVEGQWEKDGGGTGVGLALTSEFIRLMHGDIQIESEPGKGSLFMVMVPLGKEHLGPDEFVLTTLKEEEEHAQVNIHLSPAEWQEKHEKERVDGLHVLIIEDNDDLRAYLRENLEEEYLVCEAENGSTGLELAFSRIPDIIISDIIMPEIQGIDLCSMLKNDERSSHIPIILLTARTTGEDKLEGLRAGADDYLFKPFDIKELKVRIANLLAQREKLRMKFGLLTSSGSFKGHAVSIDERFVKRVMDTISQNLHDFEFDVGALQEKIGFSRVHLHRKLKAITGFSPAELIRNQRMRRAAGLIGQRAGNVTEIALEVGYSNPSHFARVFKEYFGVSPKEYLKQANFSSRKFLRDPDTR